MPKVSIIIPIYNVEKFLVRCLDSVRSQTLQDIEIILIDDESPDNCPQLCDEYAIQDSRIKVVHKKNGGLGFARNSGLDIATGEYVTFLDSDDFVDLCTYGHLYNIVKTENLDVIYYKFKRFTNEDEVKQADICNEIKKYENDKIKDLMLDIIASEPSAKVDHKIQCSSCTAMYRLSIIRENNVRFHSERELISEDLIFNLDFLKYAKSVAFNKGEHYHYRESLGSLTYKVRADRFEKDCYQYEYIKKECCNWGLEPTDVYCRDKRFLIGYARTAISQFLASDKSSKEKKIWLNEVLSNKIWSELETGYEWKRFPLYPRIFFHLCIRKQTTFLFLLCKLKSIIK